MKQFWEILGLKKKLYTGKAAAYVIDKKDGARYEVGAGKWCTTKEYPKNLLENICLPSTKEPRYEFHYAIPRFKEAERIEKKGFFGKTRRIVSPFCAETLEKEFPDCTGFWKIEELGLYTAQAAQFIRDKKTKKEYRQGNYRWFANKEDFPFPLAEHTDAFEFIYEFDNSCSWTEKDALREIRSSFFTDLLFRKK